MSCASCTEYEIPECIETLFIESFFDSGVEYILTLTNHFGKKSILTKTANYAALIQIDITDDLGEAYFFRGNTYVLEVYESQEDFECDSPMFLCGYETCISIDVYQSSGEETDHTLNCCE